MQTDEGRRIRVVHTEVYSDDHDIPKGYEVLIESDSIVEVGSTLARKKRAKKAKEGEETEDGENAVIARIAGRAEVGKNVVTISYEEREERFYAIPAAARIIVQDGGEVRAGDPLTSGPLNPQDILRVLGREDVEKYLVEEVQKVYRAQGVTINDKHIEIVVRQMLRKVRVETPGDTELLAEQILDRFAYQEVNDKVMAEGGEPATAVAVLLGVTKASLNTESFLAAASFQETTRVLTEAAVSGTVDRAARAQRERHHWAFDPRAVQGSHGGARLAKGAPAHPARPDWGRRGLRDCAGRPSRGRPRGAARNGPWRRCSRSGPRRRHSGGAAHLRARARSGSEPHL